MNKTIEQFIELLPTLNNEQIAKLVNRIKAQIERAATQQPERKQKDE